MRRSKGSSLLTAIFLCGILANQVIAAEVIDLNIAKKVALYYGAKRWESVSIYDSRTFVDPLDNIPQVYVFTLYIGEGVPPAIEETLNKAKQAEENISIYLSKIQHIQKTDMISDINKYHAEYKNDVNMKYQSELFATIIIGANYKMSPLIIRKAGLPDYLSNFCKYQLMFESEIGSEEFIVDKYYWLGSEIYGYEFIHEGINYIITNTINEITKTEMLIRKELSSDKDQSIDKKKEKAIKDWEEIQKSSVIQQIDPKTMYHSSSSKSTKNTGHIDNVPFFWQDLYGINTCAPTAAAQVLGYWDENGYPNLVDWGNADQWTNFNGVNELIGDLKEAMRWTAEDGVSWSIYGHGEEGIMEVCNNEIYNNNLNFSDNMDVIVTWRICKEEIDANRPFIYTVAGRFEKPDGRVGSMIHSMTAVGYEEQETPIEMKIIKLHNNYSPDEDYEINFEMVGFHYIDKIYPSGADIKNPTCTILSPNNGGTYSGMIYVSADAADASGIWEYQFQYSIDHNTWIDFATALGGDFCPIVRLNSYNIEYDPSVWVRARAKDQWGNWSSWDECDQSFIVDNRGTIPTSIAANMSINPTTTIPNAVVNVSGSAIYNTGYPVTAGTVEICTSENSWTASLDGNGNYNRNIYAPSSSGYVTVYVSDGTLIGSAQDFIAIEGSEPNGNFIYNRSAMCKDYSEDWLPINETHWFRSNDELYWCWTEINNVYVPVKFKKEWYKPDGELHDITYTDWTDDPHDYGYDYWGWWRSLSGWDLNGYSNMDWEGRNTVKVYINEFDGSYKYFENQYFIISYDFKEHKMCKDVQEDKPCDAINPTNTFYQTDEKAMTWALYEDVSEDIEIKWEYYEPDGSQYDSFEYTSPDPGQGHYYAWVKAWGWILINGYNASNKCGNWIVKVYEKDPWENWDLLYKDNFIILESPNVIPNVSVIASPSNPVEGQNINLQVSATDNTYIQKVVLYWNDGTLDSLEWDGIYSNSFSQSQDIGIYEESQTIEIYSKVFDTSGNQNESSHKFITIQDSDIYGPQISDIVVIEYEGDGDGQIQSSEEVKISCSIQDSNGISEVHFFVDTCEVLLSGDYYSICGPFDEGSHAIVICATDNDNTPSSKTSYSSFQVASTEHSFNMLVNNGWNLIGLPLDVTDNNYLSVFPNSIQGTLYWFDGSYTQKSSIDVGKGYWLRFPNSETGTIEGTSINTHLNINLREGWNLISGISKDISVNNVSDLNDIIIDGTLYGFDGSYFSSDLIKQGKGYWIRASASGQITLQDAKNSLAKLNTNIESLNKYSVITLIDANNHEQKLYFDVDIENIKTKLKYSLPPIPPEGSFDARFLDDFIISESDEVSILLQADEYPVSISFNNLPDLSERSHYILVEKSGNIEGEKYDIDEVSPVVINNKNVNLFTLRKEISIPNEYFVSQNFPNPFNSCTEINYMLPEKVNVKIEVYNVVGRKVTTLVSNFKQAGYHNAVWDGRDQTGNQLGSGIYIYIIQAGKYTSVKKMIFLK